MARPLSRYLYFIQRSRAGGKVFRIFFLSFSVGHGCRGLYFSKIPRNVHSIAGLKGPVLAGQVKAVYQSQAGQNLRQMDPRINQSNADVSDLQLVRVSRVLIIFTFRDCFTVSFRHRLIKRSEIVLQSLSDTD